MWHLTDKILQVPLSCFVLSFEEFICSVCLLGIFTSSVHPPSLLWLPCSKVYGGVWNQGPARLWEDALLGLQVEGSSAGQEGEEIAPKAKANVAAP